MRRAQEGILLFVITSAIFHGVFAQAQWLRNPSFENPVPEPENPWGDRAEEWGRWGNWINRESQWAPTRNGKCLMGYHHWRVEENDSSGFYQDVPEVPDGSLCSFSIFAFADDHTNAESVELRMERLGGFEILASRKFLMEEIRRKAWGILSVTGTSKGEGIRVLVVITPRQSSGRQGAIKFDDAELIVEPATP